MANGAEQNREAVGRNNNAGDPPDPGKVWWFKRPVAIERFTGWLVLWTAFLFAANVVTDVFIWQQWRVANASQVDTREQLRAVVSVNGGKIIISLGKDSKPTFYSFITQLYNYGGTRTARFAAWNSIHFFEGDVPNSIDLTRPWDKVIAPNAIIGPNSPYEISAITLPAVQVEKAFRHEGKIILWGHADYADIFSPKENHPIAFCTEMIPTDQTTDGKIGIQPVPYKPDCNSSS